MDQMGPWVTSNLPVAAPQPEFAPCDVHEAINVVVDHPLHRGRAQVM